MCGKVYYDVANFEVTDFLIEICEFNKMTKIYISPEQDITFIQIQKRSFTVR